MMLPISLRRGGKTAPAVDGDTIRAQYAKKGELAVATDPR
jgi:hypothetical protein